MVDRTRCAALGSRDMRGWVARACLLAGLAACGRFGFGNAASADGAVGDDDAAQPDGAPDGAVDAMTDAMIDAPAVRSMTMVNGLSALPTGKLDLGVTGTPTGFTLSFTSATGGDMLAVNLDDGMRPVPDLFTTSSGMYVATSMTWTGVPMTTMTRSDNFTFIKRYELDLSSYTEMDGQIGVGAKPTYASANGRWFYAIICDDTLQAREIATDGAPIGSVMTIGGGSSGSARTGAIGGEDDTLFAVWSHTQGSCHWAMAKVGATITPTDGAVAGTCVAPRLAVEPGRAVAVMDDGASILTMTLDVGGPASTPATIATGIGARIERAAAGGYWLAWQVGAELHVATYALGGNPENDLKVELPAAVQAYELVASGDHVYLFVAANRQLWWAKLD
jgi:hypothetical protein